MSERFSWVIRDVLAGMERPGLFNSLESDLKFLKDQGVSAIVNLEEHFMKYPGFETYQVPIRDFDSPDLDTYNTFLDFVNKRVTEGRRIVVHCHAGMGRTNLMLASYLVKYNSLKPDIALDEVKGKRPVYMVTEQQKESLWEFYYTLKY